MTDPKDSTLVANSGHGHVRPRPDGVKARCGGPAICSECALELARNPMVNSADLERLSVSRAQAEKQASFQTDPKWAAKLLAEAEKDELTPYAGVSG